MKISIITATYNSASTVRDTLVSIADQEYANIEHIIIDGCSSDATLQTVQQFPHVSKVLSEKDRGIYDAMNKGIGLCTGEVIGILNSDDVYIDRRVINKVAAVFSDPTVDIVYGDLVYVKADDLNHITRTWKSGAFKKKNFYLGWMPPHPTFFVRRRVYEEAGVFNLSLRSAADYELMLRFLLKYHFTVRYIPEVLVKMRRGGISNSSLKNRLKANREDRQAWRVNGIRPYFFTTLLKPLRKVSQFIFK